MRIVRLFLMRIEEIEKSVSLECLIQQVKPLAVGLPERTGSTSVVLARARKIEKVMAAQTT